MAIGDSINRTFDRWIEMQMPRNDQWEHLMRMSSEEFGETVKRMIEADRNRMMLEIRLSRDRMLFDMNNSVRQNLFGGIDDFFDTPFFRDPNYLDPFFDTPFFRDPNYLDPFFRDPNHLGRFFNFSGFTEWSPNNPTDESRAISQSVSSDFQNTVQITEVESDEEITAEMESILEAISEEMSQEVTSQETSSREEETDHETSSQEEEKRATVDPEETNQQTPRGSEVTSKEMSEGEMEKIVKSIVEKISDEQSADHESVQQKNEIEDLCRNMLLELTRSEQITNNKGLMLEYSDADDDQSTE